MENFSEKNITVDQSTKLYLSKYVIVSMFFYYSFLFLIGNFFSLLALIPDLYFADLEQLSLAILGAIGMSLVGSTIFYIRKLYKSCINGNLVSSSSADTFLIRLGTTIYYLARPLFSVGFSLLVVVGLLSGVLTISTKSDSVDAGFVYLTMFISFFVGFSSGKFVKQLEARGDKVFNKIK